MGCAEDGPSLLGKDREAWDVDCKYGGEVGEGCECWYGEFEWCDPPVMDAVRCDDAAIAAADGSKLEGSASARPSCIVGDVLGCEPRKSFFVDHFRDNPDFSACLGGAGEGGCSSTCGSGVGKGCDLSLAMRAIGKNSSLSFLFSSENRARSSFKFLSSASVAIILASRSLMDCIIRAMSSWVALTSPFTSAAIAVRRRIPSARCAYIVVCNDPPPAEHSV